MINKRNIIKTFADLVKIDSISGNEHNLAVYIIDYLRQAGIKAELDEYGNVISKIKGEGNTLLLSAHMDTIESTQLQKMVAKNSTIKSDGKTILGLSKLPIAVLLEITKYLKSKDRTHRNLELLFTKGAELGYAGAAKIDFQNIRSKEAFVFDLCRPVGSLVIGLPFVYFLDIEIKGVSAYAGRSPEKGINALAIAAKIISELKLGKINKNTVSNFGIIQGGISRSLVPNSIRLQGEIKSLDLEKAQELIDQYNKVFKKFVRRFKGKLKFKSKLIAKGFKFSKEDKSIKNITNTFKHMGIEPKIFSSCTGSDANIFNANKIKAFQLGFGGKYSHTNNETIKDSEIQDLYNFILEIVK